MPQGHGMKLSKSLSLSPALPSASSDSPHGSKGISKEPEEAEIAAKQPLLKKKKSKRMSSKTLGLVPSRPIPSLQR